MPKTRPQLDEDSIALLERWIQMDAPWPATSTTGPPQIRRTFVIYESDRRHWAFQPVKRPELPAVKNAAWSSDDLDRFILARLEAADVEPAPRAPRRTLMRRLAYDLTGLPPSPSDLQLYLAADTSLTMADYVDSLMSCREFGEHWARHWLDHVRYRPNPQKLERDDPYRLWVVNAFNDDLPYNQFLKLQIAGDLLPAAKPEEVHLDGLIAVRPWSIKSRHHEQLDLLGRTFMGLSLVCAQCHDHKLEPIGRQDYFALQGIFESSRVVKVPFLREKSAFDQYMGELERTQRNEARMKKELKQYSAVARLVDLRDRLAAERRKLDDPQQNRDKVQQNIDKLLADEQQTLADLKNRKLDVDAPEAREYMKLRQENNEFTARWKGVFQLDTFTDQADPEMIADAAPPKLNATAKSGEPPPTDPPVPRRFPTILAGHKQTPLGEQTAQSGRLELANWLADAEHPITARLITNRVWYYLLGEGLVPSLSNFGRSGQSPSHPELLDYLSDELVRRDWSLKQLIRRIVLSSTYQQTSQMGIPPSERDRRLPLFGIARGKRLEVESIYRTLVRLEYDSDATQRRDPPLDVIAEMRLLFDGANRDLIVPRRTSSVSPLQSLFLMNSPHVKETTERIAARLSQLADDETRIQQAHLLLFGREATDVDVNAGKSFLATWESNLPEEVQQKRKGTDVPPEELARWQAYLQVLLLTNEFLFVD